MAQICKVCAHPKRSEIDTALALGQGSERHIADTFGVPAQSVHRHKAKHLPSLLSSLTARVQAFEADEIMGQVVGLYERSLELLGVAEARLLADHRPAALSAASRAIREARGTVELMAKLSIAMRDEENRKATQVENTVDIDLDRAISDALARRGTAPQGERAHASTPALLALPAGIEDAEIVVDE